MKRKKVLVGVAVAGIVAGIVTSVMLKKLNKREAHKRLSKVADEGYETADDILFPGKRKKVKTLRYGPVLPL